MGLFKGRKSKAAPSAPQEPPVSKPSKPQPDLESAKMGGQAAPSKMGADLKGSGKLHTGPTTGKVGENDPLGAKGGAGNKSDKVAVGEKENGPGSKPVELEEEEKKGPRKDVRGDGVVTEGKYDKNNKATKEDSEAVEPVTGEKSNRVEAVSSKGKHSKEDRIGSTKDSIKAGKNQQGDELEQEESIEVKREVAQVKEKVAEENLKDTGKLANDLKEGLEEPILKSPDIDKTLHETPKLESPAGKGEQKKPKADQVNAGKRKARGGAKQLTADATIVDRADDEGAESASPPIEAKLDVLKAKPPISKRAKGKEAKPEVATGSPNESVKLKPNAIRSPRKGGKNPGRKPSSPSPRSPELPQSRDILIPPKAINPVDTNFSPVDAIETFIEPENEEFSDNFESVRPEPINTGDLFPELPSELAFDYSQTTQPVFSPSPIPERFLENRMSAVQERCKTTVGQLTTDVQNLAIELAKTKEELENEKERTKRLEEVRVQYERDIDGLSKELRQMTIEMRDSSKRRREFEDQSEQLHSILAELDIEDVSEIRRTFRKMKEHIHKLEGVMRNQQRQLEWCTQTTSHAHQQYKALECEVESARKARWHADMRRIKVEEERENEALEVKKTRLEMDQLRSQVSHLKEQLRVISVENSVTVDFCGCAKRELSRKRSSSPKGLRILGDHQQTIQQHSTTNETQNQTNRFLPVQQRPPSLQEHHNQHLPQPQSRALHNNSFKQPNQQQARVSHNNNQQSKRLATAEGRKRQLPKQHIIHIRKPQAKTSPRDEGGSYASAHKQRQKSNLKPLRPLVANSKAPGGRYGRAQKR